jgi:hypothetical protein
VQVVLLVAVVVRVLLVELEKLLARVLAVTVLHHQ